MKKVLLAFIFVAAFAMLLGTSSFAADATHGDLVVHFKAWDENYTDLGSWAWGDTAAGKRADGVDDFGAAITSSAVEFETHLLLAVSQRGTSPLATISK